jgi:uncharacterized protein
MIIRVSELPGEGLNVTDAERLRAAFTDPSWRLREVDLHVSRDGVDVLVEGAIGAEVPLSCGRCLEPFPVEVRARVDSRFVPRPAAGENIELSADDLETDVYADDQLDLGALVVTETTLALPMKPLCREDCKGLCPVCGGNRNITPCACAPRATDPRLAVLRKLATRPNP